MLGGRLTDTVHMVLCVYEAVRKKSLTTAAPPNFNFSITKSPVLKPAPVRTSCNTVYLDTPTSSIFRLLRTQENMWKLFFQ